MAEEHRRRVVLADNLDRYHLAVAPPQFHSHMVSHRSDAGNGITWRYAPGRPASRSPRLPAGTSPRLLVRETGAVTETVTGDSGVPYYSQWESPDLVPQFIDGSLRPADDPRWAASGARSPLEYE